MNKALVVAPVIAAPPVGYGIYKLVGKTRTIGDAIKEEGRKLLDFQKKNLELTGSNRDIWAEIAIQYSSVSDGTLRFLTLFQDTSLSQAISESNKNGWLEFIGKLKDECVRAVNTAIDSDFYDNEDDIDSFRFISQDYKRAKLWCSKPKTFTEELKGRVFLGTPNNENNAKWNQRLTGYKSDNNVHQMFSDSQTTPSTTSDLFNLCNKNKNNYHFPEITNSILESVRKFCTE